jgi:hypothetical protein
MRSKPKQAGRPRTRTEPMSSLNLKVEPSLKTAFDEGRDAERLSGPEYLARLLERSAEFLKR